MKPRPKLFLLRLLQELIDDVCKCYDTDPWTAKRWIIEEIEKK